MISYLSVCSGIEAWSVACEGLGFSVAGFSEIEAFPSAVLAHRYGSNMPGEELSRNGPPNFGDFTRLIEDERLRAMLPPVDLLVGGTPCQAFSFAGKRLSLADARGNLTLAFAVLAHELARSHGLRNALWENVPGCLSTADNAFGCLLGALVGADAPLDLPPGIGRWPDEGMVEGPRARAAWRVLDAQYFGLAQRRERVFVVVDLGGGADPAAVLFEPQSLRGNSPPRRRSTEDVAGTLAGGARRGGGYSADDIPLTPQAFGGGNCAGPIDVAARLTAKGQRIDFEVETFIAFQQQGSNIGVLKDVAGVLPKGDGGSGGGVPCIAHTLRGEGFDASEDGAGRGIPLVPQRIGPLTAAMGRQGGCTGPEGAAAGHLVPFILRGHSDYGDGLPCLRAEGGDVGGNSEARIAFDTTLITSAANRSNPQPGDPCHPLAAQAHPPVIAFDARQSDLLIYGDLTGPLDTDWHSIAIVFSGKDHGADASQEIAPTMRAMGHGESHANADGQIAVAFGIAADALDRSGEGAGATAAERSGLGVSEELSPTLKARRPNAVAFALRGREGGSQFEGPHDTANIRAASGGSSRSYVATAWAVRRLLTVECDRLQGLPDGWARIPWRGKPAELCPDGPIYKALGNSMAVNVMRWLAGRLAIEMARDAQ